MLWSIILLTAALLLGHAEARAGEADVLGAALTPAGDGTWRVEVTVEHADTGWDHYADAFEVIAPDGTVLGTRTLLHPHEAEQPFTRSLSGVRMPDGVAVTPVTWRSGGVLSIVKVRSTVEELPAVSAATTRSV